MAVVFVTGGTGFVGSHVVEALVEVGYETHVIARDSSRIDGLPNGVVIHRCPLHSPDTMATELGAADHFVHVAGLTAGSPADMRSINGDMVGVWMDALVRHAPHLQRFVLISSLAAARPSIAPLCEDAPSAPVSAYGHSKRRGEVEALTRADRLPVTILRPPAIYGPRDRDIFLYFRFAARGFLPMIGDPSRPFSALYARDLARAVCIAMQQRASSGRTYFVTDGQPHTWEAFGRAVAEAVGRKARMLPLPAWVLKAVAGVADGAAWATRRSFILSRDKARELLQPWVADGSAFVHDTGFVPEYDLDRGVAAATAWYRENGWIC